MKKVPYQDLHNLPEDERIDLIGHYVTKHGLTAAFMVDDTPGKAERYISKLEAKFPDVMVVDRFNGPVKNVITVKVCRRPAGGVN
jgi:hypothetical protein